MNRKLARKQRRQQPKVSTNKLSIRKLGIILGICILVLFAFVLLLSSASTWDGKSRLSMAILQDDGSVQVMALDSDTNKLTTITVPGNTLVQAANQMGEWPLKSIESLARNEGRNNDFVSHTITKTFAFPVDAWADDQFLKVLSPNPIIKLQGVLKAFPTTLTFADKLKIAWKTLNLRPSDTYTIDLVDTTYLEETQLLDGTTGFRVSGDIPSSIAVLFADEKVSLEEARVAIIDKSSALGIAKAMSSVIEVIGSRVYSVKELTPDESDCVVVGTKKLTVAKIASVFGCQTKYETTESGFDVVITIGDTFAKRY